ncbi:MAG: M48 family metalloprotease [Rhodospirillales bacterium]|nr:M48 family metalloprotease [Rhodospirillales bacterium]
MMMISPVFRRFGAVLAVLLLMGGVVACAVNPATGERRFTAFMSPEDEKRIGADEHPKIIKQFGGAYDEVQISAYVAQLGTALVKVSELPDDPFRFTVLDSDQINAFALPGGYVYVTRGLIALAENEAELAGVIGHEIGHVTARHTATRYSQAMITNIGMNIVGLIGSVYGAPRETAQLLSVGAEAILSGYSREQELEADMLGVRYMSRAGYDPNAIKTFFEKMKAHDELRAAMTGDPTGEEAYNFRSSHPRTTERIEQAIRLVEKGDVSSTRTERDRFLDHIDHMLFGDDPKQGIRKGRDFIHQDLRITFSVPVGYILSNAPTQVVARHKNGGVIIFDMEDPDKARSTTDLHWYLTDDWAQKLNIGNVEQISINGMTAWTGSLRKDTQSGPRDIRLIAIRGDADQIFRLVFLTPTDKFDEMADGLKRMTYSFRRLTETEAAAVKPLRIEVEAAQSGDTPETLSNRMSIDEFSLEWFNLINKNHRKDSYSAGDRVKLFLE